MRTFLVAIFSLFCFEAQAWNLQYTAQAQEMRFMPQRQELLVKNDKGVWRFDQRGLLIRGPAPSNDRLWGEAHGKAPASTMQKVEAIYVPSSGLVFMLLPEEQRVHVVPMQR